MDLPTTTDVVSARDVAALMCAPGDCGPHGHSHDDHCHCDEGYIDRNNCCVPPPPCSSPDDSLEENDEPDHATAVPAEGASYDALRVCPADSDVFRVPLRTGQAVTIRSTFTHRNGDVDLYLYAPGTADLGHAQPLARSNGTTDMECRRHPGSALF